MWNYDKLPGLTRNKMPEYENEGQVVISIITAYYNGHKYFDATVNAILNQTYPFFEWIVVNDGSTMQESVDKLNEVEKMDPRIKVYHKENTGLANTRDYGAERASSDSKYFFIIDCDDVITTTMLEKLYWSLETNPKATWACSSSLAFGTHNYMWHKQYDFETQKKENLLTACSMIRKSDFFEVGGYLYKEKGFFEDWILWLRFMEKGKFPIMLGSFDYWYRRNDGTELSVAVKNPRSAELLAHHVSKLGEAAEGINFPLRNHSDNNKDFAWNYSSNYSENMVFPKVKADGRKHILMFIPWTMVGGADQFNLDLVKNIDKEKFHFTVMTTLPAFNVLQQEFMDHCNFYELPNFLAQHEWIDFIDQYIENNRVDVVMVTNSQYGYHIIPHLKNKHKNLAVVDYVHSAAWSHRNGGFSRDANSYSEFIQLTATCNEVNTKFQTELFKRDPKNVRTVYIGVDAQHFSNEGINKDNLKDEMKVPKDKYVIGFIARMAIEKRPLLLQKIMKAALNGRNDLHFVIAGDGEYFKQVKQLCHKDGILNNITFLGEYKEAKNVYAVSDMTINCSLVEGLALTSYESLSMGVPVISADVGGQRELIDETVGRLIPCLQDQSDIDCVEYKDEEVNSYVVAISEVIEDLENLSKNARAKIIDRFKLEDMVANMEKIFIDAIELEKANPVYNPFSKLSDEIISEFYGMNQKEYDYALLKLYTDYYAFNFPTSPDEISRISKREAIINLTKKLHIYEESKLARNILVETKRLVIHIVGKPIRFIKKRSKK